MPNTAADPSRLCLSQLAPATVQSEIRAMTLECDRMSGINLAQGICDTPVPAPVEEGAIQAIRDGQNIYTRLDGISRLRNAISAKQQRDYGLDYDPESEVLVSSGATGGLHAAAMALLNPGDEGLIFEPFYGYHSLRAGWGAGHGCLARRHHPANARDPFEHSGQPQRQGFFTRRDGIHRRRLPGARPLPHYR